ncbi:hypothetical protein P175DRAFT_0103967 [Aspergillus ochraceoroseus IBT 24754]|uniref:Uncharacterized protein n=1 Tax=Aspergillus ochraceoroseus IBT 24754 TaxID=1392256 RepID=A0A2T5LLT9_9EURO|nr:uncharacterized protein P175DRAFT_0103967 [Aspergillus ochraceoroseus IBT 24754]PTU17251.1 hypothetical protein P175DRAFT_0103967 [Aspergillus ochraceoroseus IBT 24754]
MNKLYPLSGVTRRARPGKTRLQPRRNRSAEYRRPPNEWRTGEARSAQEGVRNSGYKYPKNGEGRQDAREKSEVRGMGREKERKWKDRNRKRLVKGEEVLEGEREREREREREGKRGREKDRRGEGRGGGGGGGGGKEKRSPHRSDGRTETH